MRISAFKIMYFDDRDPDGTKGKPSARMLVVPGAATIEQAREAFADRTTPHYRIVSCKVAALADVDALERSMALGDFAKALGIAILDEEDESTARCRLADRFDLEVTDEMVEAALEGVRAARGSIPLVTETETGENAVADAMLAGLRNAGLIHEDAEPAEQETAC